MRERLVFEIADREFDDGVLAMLGLDVQHGSVRLVANAKYCELGNRSACLPTRRVRRAISLQPWSLVSAVCASPPSGYRRA